MVCDWFWCICFIKRGSHYLGSKNVREQWEQNPKLTCWHVYLPNLVILQWIRYQIIFQKWEDPRRLREEAWHQRTVARKWCHLSNYTAATGCKEANQWSTEASQDGIRKDLSLGVKSKICRYLYFFKGRWNLINIEPVSSGSSHTIYLYFTCIL